MARKGTKIALTYFITITVTFIIIGGICWLLLQELTSPKEQEDELPDIERMADTDEYAPSAEDNRTTLFIFDSRKRMSGCCFMIVRMIADERRLVIMPVSADTRASVDGTEDSIYEFYRKNGSLKAASAVESAVGVKIDYYIKLNDESFGTIVDIFGGADMDIPYNLVYSDTDTGEETIIREGTVYLDSQLLRKVITYPLYDSGEEYRAKMMGVAVNDLINKNIREGFSSHIDDYFSAVINSPIETNFTAYDYEELSEAMKYISESDEKVCRLVIPVGSYDDNSLFVLDENFLMSLTERFKLYSEEDSESYNGMENEE